MFDGVALAPYGRGNRSWERTGIPARDADRRLVRGDNGRTWPACCRSWLSKGHGVGRGLRVAEWDPFAKKDPKIKGGGVPNASESLSIKLRAWGDGTQSVVSIPEVGNGSLLWRGINRRSAVVAALIEDEGRRLVHFALQAV